MWASVLWWLVLAGCTSTPKCGSPEDLLATSGELQLTCSEAKQVGRYVHLLAGRPPAPRERTQILAYVRDRWSKDATAGAAWLAEVGEAVRGLEGQRGIDGAEKRASAIYDTVEGSGLITPEDGEIWSVVKFRISVWARDHEEKLALTEADIEGWIFYASLCREAQGGGTLRLSVADRQQLYKALQKRWEEGSRADLTALAAMGPFWPQVRRGWSGASYERQQAWISKAPLPPPMTASSVDYAGAVFREDLSRHVSVLHGEIGPFYLRVD